MQSLKQWAKGDRGGPGSMSAAEDDTTRQRELAVLELAKQVVRTTCENSRALMIKALRVAVNDLTAPQPVDPQTLEPGTRFRMVHGTEVYRFVGEGLKDKTLYGVDREWGLFALGLDSRVIPLPDDTE